MTTPPNTPADMEEKKSTFNLRFGAAVFSIGKQLKDQGILKFDKAEIEHFQNDADAVVRLKIRALLPLSTCKRIEQKICNRVASHLSKYSRHGK